MAETYHVLPEKVMAADADRTLRAWRVARKLDYWTRRRPKMLRGGQGGEPPAYVGGRSASEMQG